MRVCLAIVVLAVIPLSPLAADAGPAEQTAVQIQVGPAGRLEQLTVPGKEAVVLTREGGFRAYDAAARKSVALAPLAVKHVDAGTVCQCEGDGLLLRATFTTSKAFVRVVGELENTRKDERGVLLDYLVPPLSADAVFANDLERSLRLADGEPYEGNVFPIAAMCGQGRGIAVAIPPTEPCVFGMARDRGGLAARFYLGLSPEPKRFANRARFSFLLYAVEPEWGFRSALAAYYGFFPDYYRPRLKREGLFMFQMADRVPANIEQYGFDLVESQWKKEVLRAAIARDEQHGIATFPYMIVGQREIKFLPKLPQDYDEAMAAYQRWTVADQAGHALTKENAASQGDVHLKQEVESSACHTRDGRFALVIRNTPWGDDSVSFKMNPNPDLFRDENRPTVASYAFELMRAWLQQHPQYDGMFVDSLGANWPALLNYRREHFRYARFPLTFDPQGKVALQNDLSHYEYIDALRTWLRSSGRLVLANGVYAYHSKGAPPKPKAAGKARGAAAAEAAAKPKVARPAERQTLDRQLHEFTQTAAPPEHYRAGTKLGRFFCSALLDVASSEAGVQANVERCQDVRVFMGRKPYAFLNYHWEDAALVEEFVNKSLCFGIFASTSTNFFSGVQYEDHPQGYLRDKQLLDWYVPLVRRLSQAGWEPVRRARIGGDGVWGERFGRGATVYFTLYNDLKTRTTGTLDVDLQGLGFAPASAALAEIARNAAVAYVGPGRVRLDMEPKRTYVIQVSPGDRP